MSKNGFIGRSNLKIPSGGDANDLPLNTLKEGYYAVDGTGSLTNLTDYATLIKVRNCVLFIPRNTKGVIFCAVYDTKWSSFYKFTGVLV